MGCLVSSRRGSPETATQRQASYAPPILTGSATFCSMPGCEGAVMDWLAMLGLTAVMVVAVLVVLAILSAPPPPSV
jgi:hypothetical protein